MADEKVVKYDKERKDNVLSSSRGGKNAILLRYTFARPVVCAMDAYIKESCLHRAAPRAGTACANCTHTNQCAPATTPSCGGTRRFTPAPVNEERRQALAGVHHLQKLTRESLRANQRNTRYHKRAIAKRAH